ncbi:MAG: hypothetical protein ACRDP1_16710 [Nocardioidaceae bacterium]
MNDHEAACTLRGLKKTSGVDVQEPVGRSTYVRNSNPLNEKD